MNNNETKLMAILNRPFPMSFLIQKPYWGILSFFIILYIFVVLYHPLGIHETVAFSFSFTMLIYCLLISLMVLGMSILIKRNNAFSKTKIWTVSKEISSIILLLTTIGISAFLFGFMMEDSSSRWNMSTFIDSFFRAVAIGVIPVFFPSLLNIRYAFTPEIFSEYKSNEQNSSNKNNEPLIQIESKAKKEELSFYPNEFIYAESEGNYVVFHLMKESGKNDVMIRNSISNIESQLQSKPFLVRIHRAFIVNLKKVSSKKGNSLGYQLEIKGSNKPLPVSRQNTKKFDELSQKFLLSTHH